MSTAVAPLVIAPTESSLWRRRLPLALLSLAFFAWLLWSVSSRQALLFLCGVGLGCGLSARRFGFTTGWRHLVQKRDPGGAYGQVILIGVLATLSIPILSFFPETTAALGPLSISLLVGSFVFGLCMQIADGCGSGTVYKAGMGIPLNMAILPLFILGSFLGSVHLNDWLALGTLEPVGLLNAFGPWGTWLVTIAGLAVVAVIIGRYSGQRLSLRTLPRKWLYGALVLAIFAALTLFISGQPWGIVYGLGLLGAKTATVAGVFEPSANAFWADPGHAQRLHDSLLLDITSITNIGILTGALLVAPFRPDGKPLTRAYWIGALIAGFFLGYSSRLAFGCNVGAMVSGISTGSLHGWIWVPMAFLGSLLGLRIRARLEGARA